MPLKSIDINFNKLITIILLTDKLELIDQYIKINENLLQTNPENFDQINTNLIRLQYLKNKFKINNLYRDLITLSINSFYHHSNLQFIQDEIDFATNSLPIKIKAYIKNKLKHYSMNQNIEIGINYVYDPTKKHNGPVYWIIKNYHFQIHHSNKLALYLNQNQIIYRIRQYHKLIDQNPENEKLKQGLLYLNQLIEIKKLLKQVNRKLDHWYLSLDYHSNRIHNIYQTKYQNYQKQQFQSIINQYNQSRKK